MALSRRGAIAIAIIAAATTVLLALLWAFAVPALIGLPAIWWADNLLATGGMALVVMACSGTINLLYRLRWRKRRPAELPVRQLLSLLFGSTVAVVVAWAAALHRVPAPYGLALAGAHLGMGVLMSLLVMSASRLLLRWEMVRKAAGTETIEQAPRLSWSRVGLRGYLLLVVGLLGVAATCLVGAYQHAQMVRESNRQRERTSVTLIEVLARRAELVPRARILSTVGRARLPTGTVVRVVTLDGRYYQGDRTARTRAPDAPTTSSPIRLAAGGQCRAKHQRAAGCRWIRLRLPHDELALVALTWPGHSSHGSHSLGMLLLFVLVLGLLASVVAYLMGRDVSLELEEVASRVHSMTERPSQGLGEPLRPTTTDEMGELLQRFGQLRQVLEGQLAQSAQEVHRSAAVDRAKTAFLEEVNFALRTPLTAIIGYAELLQDGAYGAVTPDQAQEVQITLESSEQLLGLVQDIVDVSFAEAGGIELRPEAVDLGGLARSEVAAARAGMERETVTLRLEVPTDLPTVVLDPVRIRRVVANLLSNAIKFTGSGEVVLTVKTVGHSGVQVGVRDTGVGIAPEHHRVIFEQYRQAPQARPKELRGSGLGLAIVQQLVRLHGGRVWLESTPGEGSEFFFSLPLSPTRAPDDVSPTVGGGS